MRLAAPQFEEKLRALHRAELQKTPDLRERFKRARKSNSSAAHQVAKRLFIPLVLITIAGSALLHRNHYELALALISLWGVGTAFRGAHRWFHQFYGVDDLLVLHLLPVNDEQIFRIQKRRYLLSFSWTLWEMLLAYAFLAAFISPLREIWYVLPLAALLQTVLISAMALHLARFAHYLPLGAIAGFLRLSVLILFFWAANQSQYLTSVMNATHWIFPTGWVNYVLIQVWLKKDFIVLVLLLPIAALIFATRSSWERLKDHYSLEGLEVGPSAAESTLAESEEPSTKPGPTEIEDNIREGFFLGGPEWPASGWLEKLISRFLNAREQLVAEFLAGDHPGWSRSYLVAVFIWLSATAVVWGFGRWSGTLVFMAAYFAAALTLPLFGGEWRGLQQAPSGSVFMPAYAMMPITFTEIARIILKVNLIRIFTAFPLLLIFAIVAGLALESSGLKGALLCTQFVGILLLSQPLLILLPISRGTNDTRRMRVIMLVLLFPVALAIVLLSLGILFFAQELLTRAVLYLGIMLLSLFFFFLYRWAYRAGKFDLLSERFTDQI